MAVSSSFGETQVRLPTNGSNPPTQPEPTEIDLLIATLIREVEKGECGKNDIITVSKIEKPAIETILRLSKAEGFDPMNNGTANADDPVCFIQPRSTVGQNVLLSKAVDNPIQMLEGKGYEHRGRIIHSQYRMTGCRETFETFVLRLRWLGVDARGVITPGADIDPQWRIYIRPGKAERPKPAQEDSEPKNQNFNSTTTASA